MIFVSVKFDEYSNIRNFDPVWFDSELIFDCQRHELEIFLEESFDNSFLLQWMEHGLGMAGEDTATFSLII